MNKVFVPANQITNSVFFTEGDPIQQRISRIGQSNLVRKIKIALLLSESIVIPASHIIESRLTFNIISGAPFLLTKKVIIPSLPSQFSTVSEYAKERFASSAITPSAQRSLFKICDFLDENTSKFIWRNDQEMRSFYKHSLLRDLQDSNSLLFRSLNLSSAEIEALIEQISRLKPISRETSFELANRLDEKRRKPFILYLQTLYCVTGSLGNNSDPLLNSALVPFLRDKIARIPQEYDPHLFLEVLKSIGVAETLLDRISLQEIPDLSRESSVRRFREKYRALIDKARRGLVDVIGEEFSLQTLQDILLDLIGKELNKEKRVLKVKNIWTFSSFATALISSGIALASGSQLVSAASAVSSTVALLDSVFSLSDPIIERILSTKTEFITFSSSLRKRAMLG